MQQRLPSVYRSIVGDDLSMHSYSVSPAEPIQFGAPHFTRSIMSVGVHHIRVLVVDDHDAVRAEIAAHLSEDGNIQVVGEASNGHEALAKASELSPDVILMDISMPEMNGFEATKILKERTPSMKIIAITMHNNHSYVLEMQRLGASGLILKDESSLTLIHAIKKVAAGENLFS